jgi:hypothetical protein
MFNNIRQLRSALARKRLRRRVLRALALNRRGEARRDTLSLNRSEHRLQIEWRAREVHPWDRDVPEPRLAQLFAVQCLDDASAALERLFSQMPELDVIEFSVRHPISSMLIMSGCVARADTRTVKAHTSGMRLKQLGVTYRLCNWQFQPLV